MELNPPQGHYQKSIPPVELINPPNFVSPLSMEWNSMDLAVPAQGQPAPCVLYFVDL